jgi:hypothetical protein
LGFSDFARRINVRLKASVFSFLVGFLLLFSPEFLADKQNWNIFVGLLLMMTNIMAWAATTHFALRVEFLHGLFVALKNVPKMLIWGSHLLLCFVAGKVLGEKKKRGNIFLFVIWEQFL